MRCYLMNKNATLFEIEFNTITKGIDKIYKIYDIDHSPLAIKNAQKDKSKSILKELNIWFKGRGIPSWRKDLKRLLNNLNISTTEELLDKAYALSLSDQYWIKDINDNIKWQDINFFTNDFEYRAYFNASFSSDSKIEKQPSLYSPNNTTDGMLQKAWIIENGNRVLVKGTYTPSRQEPLNEWLVSNICRRLGFEYCDYTVDIIDNRIVSKCINFINENEEIITASDLFDSLKQDNNTNDFEHYINVLEYNGLKDARINLENMVIIDYLVMNEDRHLKNFGAIRNVENLKYERLTPIFDTGQSMQCDKLTSEINFYDGYGKFFYNTRKPFSKYLDYIEDISRINIDSLDGIIDEYHYMLHKYQDYIDISDERINKLVNGLALRIEKFSLFQEKYLNKQIKPEYKTELEL